MSLAEKVLEVPSGRLRNNVILNFSRKFGTFDPVSGAAWIEKLDAEREKQIAVEFFAEGWAFHSPRDAAEWAMSLNGQLRKRALRSVAQRWGDLNELGEWLGKYEASPELDEATSTFARRTAVVDPAAAFTWAREITQKSVRQGTIGKVLKKWGAFSPEEVTDYINSADSDSFRQELVYSLLSQFSKAAKQHLLDTGSSNVAASEISELNSELTVLRGISADGLSDFYIGTETTRISITTKSGQKIEYDL